MQDNVTKNCWEYWNCSMEVREKCPAFTTNSGKECWMVVGSYNSDKLAKCPKLKNGFKGCWKCPWFQKNKPNI